MFAGYPLQLVFCYCTNCLSDAFNLMLGYSKGNFSLQTRHVEMRCHFRRILNFISKSDMD